jgi:hypothetical protein
MTALLWFLTFDLACLWIILELCARAPMGPQ